MDAHLGKNRREGHPRRQCEVLHVVTSALAVAFASLSSPSGQQSPAPPQVNPLVRPGAPRGRAGRGRGGGGPVGLRGVAGDVGNPVHRKGGHWSSSPATGPPPAPRRSPPRHPPSRIRPLPRLLDRIWPEIVVIAPGIVCIAAPSRSEPARNAAAMYLELKLRRWTCSRAS